MATNLPFEGIRVLDFSWVAAGPFATRFLADFGAEVIVVESGKRSGGLRGQAPMPPGRESPNTSTFFNSANTNKLSITVDMNLPRAQELMRQLATRCDVVVDNFRPGIMARWGLAYDDLVKVKPDIIVASMPMVGSTGPFRHWGGFGTTAFSLSGMLELTGFPESEPLACAIPFPDSSCNPTHFAVALLAALRHRRRTGQGQWIDASQMESTMAAIGPAILQALANGTQAERTGNREGTAAPCGIYRCAGDDRWCAIEVHTTAQWEALCEVMEHAEWRGDPRFRTAADRWANRAALDAAVEAWTTGLDPRTATERLQAAGVPAGAVNDSQDLVDNDPQLAHRAHFFSVPHPEMGQITAQNHAFRLAATPGRLGRAPLLGEHNEDVFGRLLGLSRQEITDLVAEGIIA